MNLTKIFYLKKDLKNWLIINNLNILILILAILIFILGFQTLNYIFMIGSGILLGMACLIRIEKALQITIGFVIPVIVLIAFNLFNQEGNVDKIIDSKVGKIIESKKSYAIIKIGFKRYYLDNFETKFILGQNILITGKLEPISGSNYYSFDFREFLIDKRVFFKIKIDNFELQETNNIKFWFWNNIDKLKLHEMTKVFVLMQKDKEIEFINILNEIGLTYFINFNGISIFFFLLILNKIIKKIKYRKTISITINVIFFGWWYLLNSPLVMFRVITYSLLKNLKINKLNINIICLYLMIVFFPNFAWSPSFWYINIAYIFLSTIDLKSKEWRSIFKEVIICSFIFIPIQINYEYRVNLLSELYELFLMPFFAFLYLIVPIISLFKPLYSVLDQFQLYLLAILKLVSNLSIYWNIGKQFEIGIVIVYILVYLTIKMKYQLRIILIDTVMILFIIFINWITKSSNFIEMLNVGNGNTFVYHNKFKNITILFDAGVGEGKSKNLVFDFLKYKGINKIDLVIISHFHSDHMNVLPSLEEKMNIKEIIYRDDGIKVFKIKNIVMQIFINELADDENNHSMVIIVDIGNFRMLYTGDIEIKTESWLLNNIIFVNCLAAKRVDLLQVPHHGSKTSSSEEFIKLVNPIAAFISGEKKNNKKFPNIETIATLNKLKIKFYITGGWRNYLFNLTSNSISYK